MARAPSPLSMFNSGHDGGEGPDGKRGPMEGTHHYHYKQRQLTSWEDMGGATGQRGPNRSPPVRQRKPVGKSRSPRSAAAASLASSPTGRAESPDVQQKEDVSLQRQRPATQHTGRNPGAVSGGTSARALTTPQPQQSGSLGGRLLTPDIMEGISMPVTPDTGSIRQKGRKGGTVVPQGMSTIKRPLRNTFTAPSCADSPLAPTAARSNGISESDLCNTWFRHNRRRPRPVSQEFSSKAPAPHLGVTRTGMRDYMSLCNSVGSSSRPIKSRNRRDEQRDEEQSEVKALDEWKELAQSEITMLTQGILTKYKMGKWIPDAETVWDYHLEKRVDMEKGRVKREEDRLRQLDDELEEENKGRRSSLYDRLQCQPPGLAPEQYLYSIGSRKSLGGRYRVDMNRSETHSTSVSMM